MRPILYVAITSHGFGHAVRAISVAAAAWRLDPELLPIFVTTVPRWLIESYFPGEFIHRPRAYDVGAVQSDSIDIDRLATREKMEEYRAKEAAIIASEASFIKTNRARLVLADIPHLAAPIAKAAGVPCWMMSNFGWDFIYRDWGEEFDDLADWIGAAYSQADRLFRLPMHEPMSAFSQITEVGLTGGSPQFDPEELRDRFALNPAKEKTVLLTFGGLGLQRIPYENLHLFKDWQFITFDRQAPDLEQLLVIDDPRYRPVDFMPLCDCVLSKPGYSTFSEALRVGTPIVSLTREGFAESRYLLAGIQDYAWHQIVSQDEFFTGTWEFLRQPLQAPRRQEEVAKDGTEAIAAAIQQFFDADA